MLFSAFICITDNGHYLLLSLSAVVHVSGKEVILLMQALNSLTTPEEKLAALCKKYADLVSPTSAYLKNIRT